MRIEEKNRVGLTVYSIPDGMLNNLKIARKTNDMLVSFANKILTLSTVLLILFMIHLFSKAL